MPIIRSIEELGSALRGSRPAFVPTMGALHAGHLALVRRAVQESSAVNPVVVSVFVNPTQFGPNEDYTRYPRILEADAQAARSAGAQIIFAPNVETVYPTGDPIPVPSLPALATQPRLEDAQRPTHFAGVCQVVARLFDLVQPRTAIFGEKDYQQLLVIKAMVAQEGDRWPDLRIIAHPTVREPDGLAMSSRNAYLKPRERDRALGLFRALQAAQRKTADADSIESRERMMSQALHEHELAIDYAVVRDSETLMPIRSFSSPARALIAVRLGAVRLIDNMPVYPV